MASMQASMKELRTLKQEETTMIYLASKISDQLNRLKVEELALQNHVRLQNEELERKSRGSQRSINRSLPVEELENEELEKGENSDSNMNIVPINLVVNKYNQYEEMEEEDDDDDADKHMGIPTNTADHEDIEQFVNSL